MTIHRIRLDAQIHAAFLAEQRKDPITKEPLRAGTEIVICANDKIAFIADNWSGECPICHGSATLSYIPSNSLPSQLGRGSQRPRPTLVVGGTTPIIPRPRGNSISRMASTIVGGGFFISLCLCLLIVGILLMIRQQPTNAVDTPIPPQFQPTDIPPDTAFPQPQIQPTDAPADTPIPQPQPTTAISYCSGAPPQRVVVGDKGYVCTQYDNLIVRNGPGKSKRKVAEIATGTNFVIDKGPVCSDNWSWWRIRTTNGILGWVSEGGDSVDPYFFCPK